MTENTPESTVPELKDLHQEDRGPVELNDEAAAAIQGGATTKPQNSLFEIEDFSFDIEQTLNIGSQSTGAGAGRTTPKQP